MKKTLGDLLSKNDFERVKYICRIDVVFNDREEGRNDYPGGFKHKIENFEVGVFSDRDDAISRMEQNIDYLKKCSSDLHIKMSFLHEMIRELKDNEAFEGV